MRYMGSKNRHAKHILPIVLKDRRPNQWYVEPFVGGFNMIQHVTGPRIANDSHPYLIALFRALQSGWDPPEFVSKEQYQKIRAQPDCFPQELVGFVGFGCSYGGKWWGGYASDKKGTNYAAQSRRSCLKQAPKISGVDIQCGSYLELKIPRGSVVYCDPPYKGTTKYKSDFDHDVFWNWVRKISEKHNVFVSEYTAPPDFGFLWECAVNNTLVKNTGAKQGVERLWRLKC